MFFDWLNSYRAVGYFLEIFIAEFLFVYSLKKRALFYPKLISFLIISVFLMSFVDLYQTASTFIRLMYLLIVIAVSILGICILFDAPFLILFPACIAGVATQHIANKVLTLFMLIPAFNKLSWISSFYILSEMCVVFVVYFLTYLLLSRHYKPQNSSMRLNAVSVLVIITCIGVNRLIVDHPEGNIYYEAASSIYAIICCILALAIQLYLYRWQQQKAEALVVKELLTASEKQYEQWKTMVEFIGVQTHDLKHMLDRIERLADKENLDLPDLGPIRESVSNFSPLVKTGNDVLDVLLRNMSTLCTRQHIRFNCVSYTDCLGKYDSMSLYFLFANAIDNARAAADLVTDPDKRLIDVSLKQFGDSVVIHIWNYYEGNIVFEDELPVRGVGSAGTGYGIKSIKLLVDKFEGALNTNTENDIFHLNIILPLKS